MPVNRVECLGLDVRKCAMLPVMRGHKPSAGLSRCIQAQHCGADCDPTNGGNPSRRSFDRMLRALQEPATVDAVIEVLELLIDKIVLFVRHFPSVACRDELITDVSCFYSTDLLPLDQPSA